MSVVTPPKKKRKDSPMSIKKETKERLDNLGLPKNSYSGFLETLMDIYEEHQKCEKKKKAQK